MPLKTRLLNFLDFETLDVKDNQIVDNKEFNTFIENKVQKIRKPKDLLKRWFYCKASQNAADSHSFSYTKKWIREMGPKLISFFLVLIKRMRRWGESKTPLLIPVVESLNSQTLREFKPIIGKKIWTKGVTKLLVHAICSHSMMHREIWSHSEN